MAKVDIFKDSTKTIPMSNSQINRVDFDESEMGARKSHLPKGIKNDLNIKHVSEGGGKS